MSHIRSAPLPDSCVLVAHAQPSCALWRPTARLRARIDRWLFQLGGTQQPASCSCSGGFSSCLRAMACCSSLRWRLMLSGSINYNLSLGFILTFLLAALGVNAILHTFRNLARLRISAGRVQPVFAGDTARFTLVHRQPDALDRYCDRHSPATARIAVHRRAGAQSTAVGVPRAGAGAGVLRPGRLTIFTRFPLGLFYAWAYAELDMHCIVYPRPEAGRVPLPPARGGTTRPALRTAPARKILPACAPTIRATRRAISRGKPPRAAKRCSPSNSAAAPTSELWLDWRAAPDTLDVEGRLSRLARWVLDAHARGFELRPAPAGHDDTAAPAATPNATAAWKRWHCYKARTHEQRAASAFVCATSAGCWARSRWSRRRTPSACRGGSRCWSSSCLHGASMSRSAASRCRANGSCC